MRIWDISPRRLCDRHLLAEHRELHAIWNILINNKRGYSKHPETLRWRGKLKALYQRHELLISEFSRRGFGHHSPLDHNKARGLGTQMEHVDSMRDQIKILREKKCKCKV